MSITPKFNHKLIRAALVAAMLLILGPPHPAPAATPPRDRLSASPQAGVERAIGFLEAQIGVNPHSLEARLLLGDLYYWIGSVDAAMEQWRLCLTDPDLGPLARERLDSFEEFMAWIGTIKSTVAGLGPEAPTPEQAAEAQVVLEWARGFLDRAPPGRLQMRVRYLAGRLCRILGLDAEAVEFFSQVRLSDPELGPWAAYQEAELLARAGGIEAAVGLFRLAADRTPGTALAVDAGRAGIMLRLETGSPVGLDEILGVIEADLVGDAAMDLVRILFLSPEPGWAATGWTAALERAAVPSLGSGARIGLLTLMDDAERVGPALQSLRTPELEREFVEALLGAGLFQRARGRLDSVSGSIQGVSPTWIGVRRADALHGAGSASTAVTELRSLIRTAPARDPWVREARVRLGFFLRRSGKNAEALEQYAAVGPPFDDPGCRAEYEIGLIHGLENRDAAMAQAYRNYTNHCPEGRSRITAMRRLGRYLYNNGHWAEAAEVYGRMADEYQVGSDMDLAYWQQARSLERLGRREQADEVYNALLTEAPFSFFGYVAAERLGRDPVPLWRRITEPETPPAEVGDASAAARREFLSIGLLDQLEAEARYRIAAHESAVAARMDLALVLAHRRDYMASIAAVEDVWRRRLLHFIPAERRREYWELSFPRYYQAQVETSARAWGVEPAMAYAVIRQESRFQERALSSSRAMGLMQIIPSTGRYIAGKIPVDNYHTDRLYEPGTNTYMGCWYLDHLSKRFKGAMHLFVAAYNGGQGNVARWLDRFGERDMADFILLIPLQETRHYAQRVLLNYYEYKRLYGP